VGGSLPSIVDRMLKSTGPAFYNSTLAIYQTRFHWDSAGPTYYHQVSGLLGYNISTTQLLFGSDYPYAPPLTQPGSLEAIEDTSLISEAAKDQLFTTNAQALFGL